MTHTELVNESSKPNVKLFKKIAKINKIFSIVLIPLYLLQSLLNHFYISTYLAKNIDKVDLFSSLDLFTYRSFTQVNWLVSLSYLIYPIALYYIYKVTEKPRPKTFRTAFIVLGIAVVVAFLPYILPRIASLMSAPANIISAILRMSSFMSLLSALALIALAIILIKLYKNTSNAVFKSLLMLGFVVLVLKGLSYVFSRFIASQLLSVSVIIIALLVIATLVINIIFSHKFYQYLNTQPEQKELKV